MPVYRVLLQDKHNGESFNFAVTVRASDELDAAIKAHNEFPESGIVYAEHIQEKRI